jgi:hypothetical protein
MSKPALGKGLGELMKGQEAPRKMDGAEARSGRPSSVTPVEPAEPFEPSEPSDASAPIKVEFGRGLGSLVTAVPPLQSPQALQPSHASQANASRRKYLLPAWFFFAADLLLLAYTVAIFFDASNAAAPFDSGTIIFCVLSITLGALLGIAGVLRAAEFPSENTESQ